MNTALGIVSIVVLLFALWASIDEQVFRFAVVLLLTVITCTLAFVGVGGIIALMP